MTEYHPHSQPDSRDDMPWYAYVLLAPLIFAGIVMVGYVIDTIAEMGGG